MSFHQKINEHNSNKVLQKLLHMVLQPLPGVQWQTI